MPGIIASGLALVGIRHGIAMRIAIGGVAGVLL